MGNWTVKGSVTENCPTLQDNTENRESVIYSYTYNLLVYLQTFNFAHLIPP